MAIQQLSYSEEPDDAPCARCEVLPRFSAGSGTLYVRFPVSYTLRKAREVFARLPWAAREAAGGLFEIDVPDGSVEALADDLAREFTSVEQAGTRALFVESGRTPTIADYLEADSLARVVAHARATMLIDVLSGPHLTAAFQPIVDAQTLAIHGYEALLRTRPGATLSGPAEIFGLAKATDLLPHTDLAARRTIIREAKSHAFNGKLFINFTPSAIYDAKSCLRSTIQALDEAGIAHDRVVFEVVESDEVSDTDHLTATLRAYRNAGFQIALDDLGSGFASLNLLHQLRPDYIKLDIALVRDVDLDPFKAMLATKLIEAGRELGLTIIAEGIERIGELEWLRASGAHLVQGFLIARPAFEPALDVRRPELLAS